MAPKRRQSATAAADTEASINITTEALTSPSAHSKRPRSQSQNVMDKERVDNLVEGFGKNFLVFLVMEAISKDHDFIHRVRQKADVDPAQRLVCVRTTDLSVTGEALKSFFVEYGEIEAFGTMSSFRIFSARILFKLRKDARKAVYDPLSIDICLKKKIGNCFPYRVLFSRILPNRIFITENATEIPSFPSKIDVRGDEGEEPLMELVQSFGEDSLMDLVKEAIYKVPKFIKTVEKQADLDPVQRQIYISEGIGIDHEFQTHTDAKEVLRSKGLEFYGKIQYCLITGEVACVQFKHRKSVLKIMEVPDEIARNGIKCARFTTLFRNPPKVH